MKNYSNEDLKAIILEGGVCQEAYKMGNAINEIMANDDLFNRACEFNMPITITIGEQTFNFVWTPEVVNALDSMAESVIDEWI